MPEVLVTSFVHGCSVGLYVLGMFFTVAALLGAAHGLGVAVSWATRSAWYVVIWVRNFVRPKPNSVDE